MANEPLVVPIASAGNAARTTLFDAIRLARTMISDIFARVPMVHSTNESPETADAASFLWAHSSRISLLAIRYSLNRSARQTQSCHTCRGSPESHVPGKKCSTNLAVLLASEAPSICRINHIFFGCEGAQAGGSAIKTAGAFSRCSPPWYDLLLPAPRPLTLSHQVSIACCVIADYCPMR